MKTTNGKQYQRKLSSRTSKSVVFATIMAGLILLAAVTSQAQTGESPLTTKKVTTTGGTAKAIPMFTTATNIQNSGMFLGKGYVGIGTAAAGLSLTVVNNSTFAVADISSSSTFGTWLSLTNTSTGGANWSILSAASGNSEGAGNLAFYNASSNSATVFIHGNLQVDGSLSKGSGSFQIDHPLDPANKFLYHSFVESPDMMDVYNGNVVTDAHGRAVVTMPEYFEALNRNFRYQLTSVGQFSQAMVAKKIANNRFVIRTSKPGVEVSWQVTGIRHDAYADAHRIPTEEMKPALEQGRYLHPELFGAPKEQAIGYAVPPPSKEADHPEIASARVPADQ